MGGVRARVRRGHWRRARRLRPSGVPRSTAACERAVPRPSAPDDQLAARPPGHGHDARRGHGGAGRPAAAAPAGAARQPGPALAEHGRVQPRVLRLHGPLQRQRPEADVRRAAADRARAREGGPRVQHERIPAEGEPGAVRRASGRPAGAGSSWARARGRGRPGQLDPGRCHDRPAHLLGVAGPHVRGGGDRRHGGRPADRPAAGPAVQPDRPALRECALHGRLPGVLRPRGARAPRPGDPAAPARPGPRLARGRLVHVSRRRASGAPLGLPDDRARRGGRPRRRERLGGRARSRSC